MDQLKVILKKLKKHHFWIVCSLVTLVAVVMVFMAVGSLDEEVGSQDQKISGSYTAVQNLSNAQLHPNEQYHQRQAELNREASDAIAQAWKSRYDRQADLLVWPVGRDALKATLVDKVRHLRPIEAFEIDDSDQLMPSVQERQDYVIFLEDKLPSLADVIGANWNPGSRSSGVGRDREAEGNNDSSSLVMWDSENQATLKSLHFPWSSDDLTPPDTMQILYAQEDLWVLEAIMEIIAETNGDETAAYKVNISQIHEISIGRAAGEPDGTIDEPAGGEPSVDMSSEGVPSAAPGSPPPFAVVPPPSASNPGGVGGSSVAAGGDPAEGRYVDRDYQPLSAASLRSSVQSSTPANAYLAVAKRMPIRMRVTMDQRRIPRLLLACGNSDLTVEVRQVHVSMPGYAGDPSAPSQGSQRAGGGMGGMGGMTGIVPGMNNGPQTRPRETSSTGSSQRVYDAEVEIYGILYIYNPVNRENLDISAEALQDDDYIGEDDTADAAP